MVEVPSVHSINGPEFTHSLCCAATTSWSPLWNCLHLPNWVPTPLKFCSLILPCNTILLTFFLCFDSSLTLIPWALCHLASSDYSDLAFLSLLPLSRILQCLSFSLWSFYVNVNLNVVSGYRIGPHSSRTYLDQLVCYSIHWALDSSLLWHPATSSLNASLSTRTTQRPGDQAWFASFRSVFESPEVTYSEIHIPGIHPQNRAKWNQDVHFQQVLKCCYCY